MTVESNPFPLRYSGDGSTTTFAVTAYFLNEEDVGGAHLKVTRRSSSGVETVLVENTDYTVTGAGEPAGGFITLTTAPASGETLVINRNVPATQRTDYQSYDSFPAESHERALDKLTMKVQQVGTEISRAISFPETDAASLSRTLPASPLRANKALVFDQTGAVTVSINNYNDTEAADSILAQAQAAATAAQNYSLEAAAILEQVEDASFIAASNTSQRFSGNSATTAFTLSETPLNEDNTAVFISGVYQQKDTYSLSGTTLTFSAAPPTGTDNIEVNVMKGYAIGTPTDGTVTTAKIVDDAVTSAKIAAGAVTNTELATNAVTTVKITDANVTEAKLASDSVSTAKIASDAVTFAKMQNIATRGLIGRATAGTGDPEFIPLGAGLDFSGGALITTGIGVGDMLVATYDPAGIAQQVAGTSATQTLTNKTLTSPVLNGSLTGTAILDEDNMTSNSDVKVPTQQSVKAYVDTGLATKAASSHTHTSSAITDLQETVEDYIGAAITAGSNVTVSYNDTTGKTTISASGGGATSDIIGLKSNYGATGNGVADDTTPVNNANTAAKKYYIPAGIYDTDLLPTQLTAPFWGDGQIRDSNNNLRGKYFSLVDSAPSSTASRDSVNTAFNGDISGIQFPVEHRITGAATVGQPTSGYLYTHEAYPHYTHLRNESGYNHSTANNDGRTGVCAFQTKIDQHGQGDAVAYNALVFVTGTKAGSTNFLANPAGVILNGSIQAGAAGVYLNTVEFDMQDGGFDCAGIGTTTNLTRTVATGAKSAVWMGHRVQSLGTQPIDVAYSATGSMKRGLDFVPGTFDASQAAIALKANQRIYLNASSVAAGNLQAGWYGNNAGSEFIDYDASSQSMRLVANNFAQLQLNGAGTQIILAPNGTNARARANNSSFDVVSDFKVSASLGGSNYFRASAAEVNCTAPLSVNGPINLYGSGIFTSSLVSAPTIAIIFKINGTNYKVNAQLV
jgi:hypothetical protein